MKNNNLKKYLWMFPALYVSYEFGGKVFEVLADPQEFIDITSVIKPLSNIANFLAHFIGFFDFAIAMVILILPFIISKFQLNQKYIKYIFLWTGLWVFVPSSLRYFGGVADFEIVQVLSISISSALSYLLYKRYN